MPISTSNSFHSFHQENGPYRLFRDMGLPLDEKGYPWTKITKARYVTNLNLSEKFPSSWTAFLDLINIKTNIAEIVASLYWFHQLFFSLRLSEPRLLYNKNTDCISNGLNSIGRHLQSIWSMTRVSWISLGEKKNFFFLQGIRVLFV